MKKILSFILVTLMLFSCTACSGGDKPSIQPTPSSSQVVTSPTTDSKESPTNDSTEITMETLLNHKESPAEDFEIDTLDGLNSYRGKDEIVVFPETVGGREITSVGQYVFANDSPVKAIRFSNSVKELGFGACGLNKNLEYVVLGDSMEIVGQGAFQNCESLKEIKLNEGLKTIKTAAFSGCTGLQSIELPDSLETIEMGAISLMNENFKIIGKAGSVAETYAKSAGIKFEAK